MTWLLPSIACNGMDDNQAASEWVPPRSPESEGTMVSSESSTRSMGRFFWNVTTGQWFWSPGMFEIHGYSPGAVPVDSDLVLSHKTAEHRHLAESVFEAVTAGPHDFSNYHRIEDSQGRTRTVLSVGSSRIDPTRPLMSSHIASGYMVDVTADERRSAKDAVQQMRRTSAPIQQTLGLLMGSARLTEDAAFAFLARVASNHNVRAREVADRFMTAVVSDPTPTIEALPQVLVREAAAAAREHVRAAAQGLD